MDKELLKALGYSDREINRREMWEKKVAEYFKDDKDHKTRLESYFQVDFQKGLIIFRTACPPNIAVDLQNLFDALEN